MFVMMKQRKHYRAWTVATLIALAATSAPAWPALASSDRMKVAMDNMMPSTPPAADAPAKSGGMGMGGMMDDKMGGSSSQGAMGQSSSSGGMMREHMRAMSGGMGTGSMGQGQVGSAGMPGMAVGSPRVDLTNRIEGRIAFLKAELQVSDAQTSAWNKFADALRSSRSHLLQARTLLKSSEGAGANRLEQYEAHLGERLEALRSARMAFTQLYSALNEAQKRTADELVVPFIEAF
jgi:hypothetical protein